jgi:hypothetical protein
MQIIFYKIINLCPTSLFINSVRLKFVIKVAWK